MKSYALLITLENKVLAEIPFVTLALAKSTAERTLFLNGSKASIWFYFDCKFTGEVHRFNPDDKSWKVLL